MLPPTEVKPRPSRITTNLPLPLSPRHATEALTHAQVYVSPLLVGGWCGLVTTALNCLPVGNLDGGRVMLVS